LEIIEPVSTEDFRQYYELRWKILRAPWHQPRGSERDPLDDDSTHLMIINSDHVAVGVGRLHFNTICEGQLRYMAVDITRQRQGHGSRLLLALETKARELGAARMVLDARETALRFYHKHGYKAVGPGHMLYNSIAHVKMEKEF
jgi:predicted GNAT family N-acyltransferase